MYFSKRLSSYFVNAYVHETRIYIPAFPPYDSKRTSNFGVRLLGHFIPKPQAIRYVGFQV